jgi:hypothetical protein
VIAINLDSENERRFYAAANDEEREEFMRDRGEHQ